MAIRKINLNNEVSKFLDNLNHPFRKEIERLRIEILGADSRLTENIKWNGPNYCCGNDDRITMRIQSPGKIQLIFHRGAKVQVQPNGRIIKDDSGLLTWKGNDRAIATFINIADIENSKPDLTRIVKDWIDATI
jgi:hypothetical protein